MSPRKKEEFPAFLKDLVTSSLEEKMDADYTLPLAYQASLDLSFSLFIEIERALYGIAIVVGCIASVYTIRKFRQCCETNLNVAARLISYKISLSVADALILFVYAPTQFVWITSYWWHWGEILCRAYKFTTIFAFHLTGNMQVLIAFDRLITMSHIAKPHIEGTTDYNNRLFLFLSWMLAFVFSLPQLFIFKIVFSDDGNPQCSSIWNEYTYLLDKEMEDYDTRSEKYLTIFMIYNMVHISMICVVPYLLELILYALILALLSDAEKGEFSGFRRFIHKKMERCFHVKRRGNMTEQFNSLPAILEDPESNSPSHQKAQLQRRPSKSAGSSPAHGRHIDGFHLNRQKFVEARVRRMSMPVNTLNSIKIVNNEDSHHLFAIMRSRRASVPFGASKHAHETTVLVPWMHTVMVARRNTRRKAFLMLSCNLLFWLPYCIHAILSSFVDLNYVNFQFACALVVFNAITNILL